MIIQLNPIMPLDTPKGSGYAWFLIDYGIEEDLLYVVVIDRTFEIWTFRNSEVRARKNITLGRTMMVSKKDDMKIKNMAKKIEKHESREIKEKKGNMKKSSMKKKGKK